MLNTEHVLDILNNLFQPQEGTAAILTGYS